LQTGSRQQQVTATRVWHGRRARARARPPRAPRRQGRARARRPGRRARAPPPRQTSAAPGCPPWPAARCPSCARGPARSPRAQTVTTTTPAVTMRSPSAVGMAPRMAPRSPQLAPGNSLQRRGRYESLAMRALKGTRGLRQRAAAPREDQVGRGPVQALVAARQLVARGGARAEAVPELPYQVCDLHDAAGPVRRLHAPLQAAGTAAFLHLPQSASML